MVQHSYCEDVILRRAQALRGIVRRYAPAMQKSGLARLYASSALPAASSKLPSGVRSLTPASPLLRMTRIQAALLRAAVCFFLFTLPACYSGTRAPRIGSAAPDFTLQDSQTRVTLSQFRGKVLVLNFWGTFCPPCIEEMPSLVEMQRRMQAKGVVVLAVSIDDDDSAYRRFLKEHSINLLTVRDAEKRVPTLYGTHGWPETYIIDRNGTMQRKFIGAVDWTDPEITGFLGKL